MLFVFSEIRYETDNSNKANHDIINLLESARYSTEPSAIDWDISKSLPNHLLMGQGKTCF